jgi:hypothetical protein
MTILMRGVMGYEDKDIMYQRGERDGLAGLNMSSTSQRYVDGWTEGRRIRVEKRIQFPWLDELDKDE